MIVLLSACAPTGMAAKALVVFTTASTASLMHTDKTLGDHAFSHYRQQDCALLHLEAGEPYCQDEAWQPMETAKHCYRSIAEVTCFVGPNPTETASRLMPVDR